MIINDKEILYRIVSVRAFNDEHCTVGAQSEFPNEVMTSCSLFHLDLILRIVSFNPPDISIKAIMNLIH